MAEKVNNSKGQNFEYLSQNLFVFILCPMHYFHFIWLLSPKGFVILIKNLTVIQIETVGTSLHLVKVKCGMNDNGYSTVFSS